VADQLALFGAAGAVPMTSLCQSCQRETWPCPGCGTEVHLDGESLAEALADPLCPYCRPIDDPRLAPRIRDARLARATREVGRA
jgi:hypothetical protein